MAFTPQQTASNAVGVPNAARSYLDTLANKYVVSPKEDFGIDGFVFDFEGESNVRLQSEITDHYAEDNSAINDHVALRPIRVVLHGFVGELVRKKPAGLLGALSLIQNRLTTLPAYLGHYTPQALEKIQSAITKAESITNQVDNALARVNNVEQLFSGAAPGKNKLQIAYGKLAARWESKKVFTVQTPVHFFTNMVIEDLLFVQDENTKSWIDITISLKQLRFVKVERKHGVYENRFEMQKEGSTDNGTTKGNKSIAATIVDEFRGIK